MTVRRAKHSRLAGIAILEAAAFMAALFAVLLGAIALVDYLQEKRAVAQLLDKQVYQAALRPLRLDESFRIVVNERALEEHIRAAAERIQREMQVRVERGGGSYFIEVLYAAVRIDPQSGASDAQVQIGPRVTFGPPGIVPAELLSNTALDARLRAMVAADPPGGISRLASPSALGAWTEGAPRLSGHLEEAGRFLPWSVVIGARAFWRGASGPIDMLRQTVGLEPVYHHVKLVPLRGDCEL